MINNRYFLALDQLAGLQVINCFDSPTSDWSCSKALICFSSCSLLYQKQRCEIVSKETDELSLTSLYNMNVLGAVTTQYYEGKKTVSFTKPTYTPQIIHYFIVFYQWTFVNIFLSFTSLHSWYIITPWWMLAWLLQIIGQKCLLYSVW